MCVSRCPCCVKGQSLRCSPEWGNAGCCTVTLQVGEGSEREQWHLLYYLPDFCHSLHYPQSNWAPLVLIPQWVSLCAFQDPVCLSNELSYEAGSFSCCCLNPHGCFHSEVWGFISLHWSPGSCGLFHSPAVPPGVSMYKCGAAGSASCHTACPIRSTVLHVSGTGCESSTPAACLRPSYQSGWMFLLYLLGCWISVRFNFLSVLVVFCF